ncbi:MAG: hypothetical protein WCF84_24155 [Anaerolineae bacterium]
MQHSSSVEGARKGSITSSKFDNYFDGWLTQFNKQHKVIVMPIADFEITQFNL